MSTITPILCCRQLKALSLQLPQLEWKGRCKFISIAILGASQMSLQWSFRSETKSSFLVVHFFHYLLLCTVWHVPLQDFHHQAAIMSSSFLPPCHFNIFPFLLFLGDTHCLFILLVQHLDCTLAHCRRTKRKRNIEIASPYPVHPKSQHAPGPQLGKPGRGFVGRKIFSRLHLLPNPPVFCHHFPCPLQAVSWPCPCLDTIPYHTIPYQHVPA